MIHKIEKPACVGDMKHNEAVGLLLNGINYDSQYTQKLLPIIEKDIERVQDRWLFRRLPRHYCQKLNAAMKAKNDKQFNDKLTIFLYHCITKHSPFHYMLYRELVHNIDTLCKDIETK
jgi:hypothetical protein